ncbi:unnamed protein product [Mytilus coruscus]|uniref:C1q domain-containing protein n=1 Tax=Mytilus coruscus TaxID=42192 RepID=A0A6J8BC80_MYTCO|nr:unnamed protein product [Mytilus coruscus]
MFSLLVILSVGTILQNVVCSRAVSFEGEIFDIKRRLEKLERKVVDLQVENENLKQENRILKPPIKSIYKPNVIPQETKRHNTWNTDTGQIFKGKKLIIDNKAITGDMIKVVNSETASNDSHAYKRLLLQTIIPTPSIDTQKIAFTVYLSKTIDKLGSHQIIEYDKILLNDGNGFDIRHGHFTAPLKGTYLLSVNIIAESGHAMALDLVNNGKPITAFYAEAKTGADSQSNAFPVHLEQGDMVWIRTHAGYEGGRLLGFTDFMLTSFAGVFLYPL